MSWKVIELYGIGIKSHGMIIDEAFLTGEADPVKKTPEDPWVCSGTQVGGPHLSSMEQTIETCQG